ncbi:MAG: N-acetylneuraminate synthase family protein [Rhizobiales bacterium]|nr:N-acetylneuraminate synthase family protein [Hyphomicrobiales bacterium]
MSRAPLLVYEVANVHGGDPAVVTALIDALAPLAYPRRAMKFHPIAADALALKDFSHHALYEKLGFDDATWARLIEDAANRIGAVFLEMADANCARVFSANKAKIAGVKFQASMVDNSEVLGLFAAAQGEDPVDVVVNVSGYDLAELEVVVARMARIPARRRFLQIGFQGYPTALSDTQLNKLAIVRARFPDYGLAFADHVEGSSPMARRVPVIAAAMGCEMIEKHVCLSRAATQYDGWSALEPAELVELQGELAQIPTMFGESFVARAEHDYLVKGMVVPIAAEDHASGRFVTTRSVIFRRTAQTGMTFDALTKAQANERMILAEPAPKGTTIRRAQLRKARVAAIVACRLKSSRLPRKALLPIGGVASVERCLEGALRVPGVDFVALATSTHPDDAALADYTLGGKAIFHRGDPDDVLRRYLDVCDAQDVDVVVRITSDCPTPSSEVLGALLEAHFAAGADLTRARREAIGSSGQIITVEAMRRVLKLMGGAPHSEYMNLYFENNPEHFNINIVDLPEHLIRDYRLTLDYPEDLEMFEALFAELKRRGQQADLQNVFKILDERPEIAGINAGIMPKYKVNEELVSMLNRVTRIAPAA